jgi:TetR/AcrR family transcriptional regulator, transcriptional repressor for nem operon
MVMPRQPSHTAESLAISAMHKFWYQGYEACSVDDLVMATGVSRHGIYASVGGKRDLFLRCFAAYQDEIVTPAVSALEANTANLGAIEAYFETQIALAERVGLPGPGCLVANAMTETAPHDTEVRLQVELHNERLRAGFRNALWQAADRLDLNELDQLAEFLATSAQGLWSMSRVVDTAAPLMRHAATLMSLIKARIMS